MESLRTVSAVFKVYKNGEVIGQVEELLCAAPAFTPLTEQDEAIAELGLLAAENNELINQLKVRIEMLEARIPEGDANG